MRTSAGSLATRPRSCAAAGFPLERSTRSRGSTPERTPNIRWAVRFVAQIVRVDRQLTCTPGGGALLWTLCCNCREASAAVPLISELNGVSLPCQAPDVIAAVSDCRSCTGGHPWPRQGGARSTCATRRVTHITDIFCLIVQASAGAAAVPVISRNVSMSPLQRGNRIEPQDAKSCRMLHSMHPNIHAAAAAVLVHPIPHRAPHRRARGAAAVLGSARRRGRSGGGRAVAAGRRCPGVARCARGRRCGAP